MSAQTTTDVWLLELVQESPVPAQRVEAMRGVLGELSAIEDRNGVCDISRLYDGWWVYARPSAVIEALLEIVEGRPL